MWSYPNVFRDQGLSTGVGKELCDLLVVCKPHVVLFSDKSVAYKDTGNVEVDWCRWYRRAVLKSAHQLLGAERWLDTPSRIYLDAKCQQPFPIEIPSRADRKAHLVVVALGAGAACRKYYGGGSGSLMIMPDVGSNGCANVDGLATPFVVGDLFPEKPFIHILDDATLSLMLNELDTITDFVAYLEKKELLIRSGRLISAAGEEDLLGYYIPRMNDAGEHDFTPPTGHTWSEGAQLIIDEGFWEGVRNNPQYGERKRADEISYLWDNLITTFTEHMLAGTTMGSSNVIPIPGESEVFDVRAHEVTVRHMAHESRFARRILAEGLRGAMERASASRPLARIIPHPSGSASAPTYVFLQAPQKALAEGESYDRYRLKRRMLLYAYCMGVKRRSPHFECVIGIAMEPPKYAKGRSSSEDLLRLNPAEWTPELEAEADRLCEALGIMQDETLKFFEYRTQEFPEVSSASAGKYKRRRQPRRARRRKGRHPRPDPGNGSSSV